MTIPEFAKVVKPALFTPHPLVALLGRVRPNANCLVGRRLPSWNRFLGIDLYDLDDFEVDMDIDSVWLNHWMTDLRDKLQDGTYDLGDLKSVDDEVRLLDKATPAKVHMGTWTKRLETAQRGQHNVEIAKMLTPPAQCNRTWTKRVNRALKDWHGSSYALLDKYGNYFKYIEAFQCRPTCTISYATDNLNSLARLWRIERAQRVRGI